MSPAIRVRDLGKLYRRSSSGRHLRTLKSALLERSLVKGIRPEDAIAALDSISFDVEPGEAVGLIGSNGSGKSTLLKMVAGILKPTSGQLDVEGRVAALIELGAGFHPEISGRENIFINGAILGLGRREIERRFDDIVEFSGLAEFIEEPVKNYSSGMYVRLGFSVAIHTDPDVLLVDEVLAVGDEAFSHRCLRRIEEFLARGKTLLLVSHSLTLIEEICDRAIWLEKGKLRMSGHPRLVADTYRQAVAEAEGQEHRSAKEQREAEEAQEPAPTEPDAEAAEVFRWGSREAEIERIRILVGKQESYHFRSGDSVVFEIEALAHERLEDFVFGIAIATPRGIVCWGTNTDLLGLVPKRLEAGTVRVEIECPELRFAPGEYLIDVAIHARDGTPYDYRRKLVSFSVTSPARGEGLYFPENQWRFHGDLHWDDESA